MCTRQIKDYYKTIGNVIFYFIIFLIVLSFTVILNNIFYYGIEIGLKDRFRCIEYCIEVNFTSKVGNCYDFCLISEWFDEPFKWDSMTYKNTTILEHLFPELD